MKFLLTTLLLTIGFVSIQAKNNELILLEEKTINKNIEIEKSLAKSKHVIFVSCALRETCYTKKIDLSLLKSGEIKTYKFKENELNIQNQGDIILVYYTKTNNKHYRGLVLPRKTKYYNFNIKKNELITKKIDNEVISLKWSNELIEKEST